MKRTICALGLAVAAMTPLAQAADAPKGTVEERCLFADRVDGFQDAKRDSIVLTMGQRKWRADFANSCSGVNFALSVAVDSKTTCVTAGDTVIFQEAGSFNKRCMINEITYLPKDEKKAEAPEAH